MESDAEKKNSGRVKKIVGYIIGLGVFSLLIYIGGVKALKSTVTPNLVYLSLAFIFMLLVFMVSSIRWGYIISSVRQEKVCSHFDYFTYFITGRFFGHYVSSALGDFLLRPAALKKIHGVNLKVGISCSILDKLLDLLFVLILIVPAALFVFGVISEKVILAVVCTLVVILFILFFFKSGTIFLAMKKFLLAICKKLSVAPFFRNIVKEQHIQALEQFDDPEVFRRKPVLFLLGITVVKYVFLVLRLYFLASAFGLKIPVVILFAGIPLAQLSLALALTPGAMGVLEGGWYAVLAIAGIAKADIATLLIGQRAYWFIFTSMIFFGVYLLNGIKKIYESSTHSEKDR